MAAKRKRDKTRKSDDAAEAKPPRNWHWHAVAVAVWVVRKARPAVPSAASALPALNPNQPTQRRAAPITVRGRLWGGIGSFP